MSESTFSNTGRLARQPNLQHLIPRTEEGQRIRQALVEESLHGSALKADYSAIELRIQAARDSSC